MYFKFIKVNINILVVVKKVKNERERVYESKRVYESERERKIERDDRKRERDNINKRIIYIVVKKKLK